MKIGSKVVRINKNTKSYVWEIVGVSNVFSDCFVCNTEEEPLHHLDRCELRLATKEEISKNKRI